MELREEGHGSKEGNRWNGTPYCVLRSISEAIGRVTATVLFSQLYYWQNKTRSALGVYKTRAELEHETGLTHNDQRTAIKKLIEKGVVIVTEKRIEHKTYYKIDNMRLKQLMMAWVTEEKPSSPQEKRRCGHLDKDDIGASVISMSLYQKNTTKTTSLITTGNTNDFPMISNLDLSVFHQVPGDKIWKAYLAYRKSKNAKLTQNMLNYLADQINQSNRQGYSKNEVLNECVLRNWLGFKACWLPIERNRVAKKRPVSLTHHVNSNPFGFKVVNA